MLTIGGPEADPSDLFYRVRTVVRLRDGRLVVADGGNNRLVFYAPSGRFLKSVGRRGGGPGEFGGLAWVRQLLTDTLLTWDFRNRRLSLFTPDGEYMRSVPLQTPQSSAPVVIGAWADGSLLTSHRLSPENLQQRAVVRESFLYVRYDRDGTLADTLGRFPGNEFYQVASMDGSTLRTTEVAVPFMRSPHVALAPRGFYFGTGDSYAIGEYARDGALRGIVRSAQGNRPVTPSVMARYKEEILAGISDPNVRRVQERAWSDIAFPKTMPAYGGFLVDSDGNLWVRDYTAPGDAPPPWQVFDEKGVWLGSVASIPGFSPSQIGGDFALGVWVDELGVEHIHLYPLLKP